MKITKILLLLILTSNIIIFSKNNKLLKVDWNDYYIKNSDVCSEAYEYGLGDSHYYCDKAKYFIRNKKYNEAIELLNVGMKYCLTSNDLDDIYLMKTRAYLGHAKEYPILYTYAYETIIKSYQINKLNSVLIKAIKIIAHIDKLKALNIIETESKHILKNIKKRLINEMYKTKYLMNISEESIVQLKKDQYFQKLNRLKKEILMTLRRNK